jgi:hypothetical protein
MLLSTKYAKKYAFGMKTDAFARINIHGPTRRATGKFIPGNLSLGTFVDKFS